MLNRDRFDGMTRNRGLARWCAALVMTAWSAASVAQPVLITASQTISPGQATITPTAGGSPVPVSTAEITVSGASTILTVNGQHSIASLTIQNSARVTHSPGFTFTADLGQGPVTVGGFWLTTSGNVTIAANSGIDVDGQGFAGSAGPGAGNDGPAATNTFGAGGSYGGNGGVAIGVTSIGLPRETYDSFGQPTQLGSGGGSGRVPAGTLVSGGAGGGAVRLNVGGTLAVNGFIRALGANVTQYAGAGSGGSIWVTANSLTGAAPAFINANGGAYTASANGGHGGGGRVAIYANNSSFTGAIVARSGGVRAGAGSIYVAVAGTPAELTYDNGGRDGRTNLFEPLVLPANANLTITGRAALGHPAGDEDGLSIDVGGNVTIAADSGIDVDGQGFAGSAGPGAGNDGPAQPSAHGAGGSYGGSGCPAIGVVSGLPGSTYGSFGQPTQLGSGGGSGRNPASVISNGTAGGGAVRLNVGGTLAVNGFIRALGANAPLYAGAGSGGSIWVTANSLTGAAPAFINANGGAYTASANGGHGGGGRVAVYACFNSYTGSVVARRGGARAQDGTVVVSSVGAQLSPTIDPFCSGTDAVLTADAGGLGTLTYQWRKDGVDLVDGPTDWGSTLSGANTSQLSITNMNGPDSGDYTVFVTVPCGSATSNAAELRIGGASGPPCDSIDFNRDCIFPDDADVVDYFNVLAGGDCPTCSDIDFNNNGIFPEDQDVVDFLDVLAGGVCQ